MANITKRTNKAGSTSYLIRVFVGEGQGEKQATKSMTWKPPAGMRPSAADKQAQKEAVLFEEKVRSGVVSLDGLTRFADYAARWMEVSELAPKTRDQYEYLLRRINKAIGHIPLEKLRVDHLQEFYLNLREAGIKENGIYAVSKCFEEKRKEAGLTQRRLCELSGVSVSTIVAAAREKRVSKDTANKLCAALGLETASVFDLIAGSDKLSDNTVRHHHTLIRTILSSAKKARIIPHSVTEFMEAPKQARTEARFLNDDEAKAFLSALMSERDIRIKTALALDLFTGLRRGELCGLSWPDIDNTNRIIHIRRASQYVPKQGIIEAPTKNIHSDRNIKVSPFIIALLADYRRWWLEHRLAFGDAWQGDKERLFIQDDGKPLYPGTINFWLKRFLRKNQLPDISPHSLRHTFITLQIMAGVDIRTLQARSGHAQASTLLNIYSHAIQSAQERAAQTLDDILLPGLK